MDKCTVQIPNLNTPDTLYRSNGGRVGPMDRCTVNIYGSWTRCNLLAWSCCNSGHPRHVRNDNSKGNTPDTLNRSCGEEWAQWTGESCSYRFAWVNAMQLPQCNAVSAMQCSYRCSWGNAIVIATVLTCKRKNTFTNSETHSKSYSVE